MNLLKLSEELQMSCKPQHILKLIGVALAISNSVINKGHSDPFSGCSQVLTAKKIHIKTVSKQAQLAWMKIINSENYQSFKDEGSIAFPGYFDGDYKSFNEKRDKLFHAENYKSNNFEAQQELSIETPPDVISSWQQCILANSKGLFAFARDIDENGATISLNWSPSPGLSDLNDVVVQIDGAKDGMLNDITSISAGEQIFILNRKSTNEVIRGAVSGKPNQNGVYSAGIYVPAMPKPPVVPPAPPAPPWCQKGIAVPLRILGHVQNVGDTFGRDGEWVGTRGRSLRLEGFQIDFAGRPPELVGKLNVEYYCHIQNSGDTGWMPSGSFCGTRGNSLRLEGFAARLTGEAASDFKLEYGCHIQNIADIWPVQPPKYCGTVGQSLRMEAVNVSIKQACK